MIYRFPRGNTSQCKSVSSGTLRGICYTRFRILRSRYYSTYWYQMVLSRNGKSFIALLMSGSGGQGTPVCLVLGKNSVCWHLFRFIHTLEIADDSFSDLLLRFMVCKVFFLNELLIHNSIHWWWKIEVCCFPSWFAFSCSLQFLKKRIYSLLRFVFQISKFPKKIFF